MSVAAAVADPRSAHHVAARVRVFDLIRAAQSSRDVDAATVAAVIAGGEAEARPDVTRLGLFLEVIVARYVEGRDPSKLVTRLLERSEADGDPVMTALGLALRARDRRAGSGRSSLDADRDLARATVLLEDITGPCTEAVSAHVECALAYGDLDLWELKLAHYEAAEACIDPAERPGHRRAVLLFNRAEVQVTWTAALRERGAADEVEHRAEAARLALARADIPEMPAGWRAELAILGELVDALVCTPAAGAPSGPEPDGAYRGHVHLARALREADPVTARGHCVRALETIDRYEANRVFLCAMARAAELEGAAAGVQTAGQRWGRELAWRGWEQRLRTRASMDSLIAAQRLSAQHATLRRHALVDELTGLANRRALGDHVERRLRAGDADGAVIVLDCDRFKTINDTLGHAVGDGVLVGIAELLRAGIRDGDLAVRTGGDEFLVVLGVGDPEAARRRAEALTASIAAAGWAAIAPGLRVTVSCGVAHGSLADLAALCEQADAALYRAKRTVVATRAPALASASSPAPARRRTASRTRTPHDVRL